MATVNMPSQKAVLELDATATFSGKTVEMPAHKAELTLSATATFTEQSTEWRAVLVDKDGATVSQLPGAVVGNVTERLNGSTSATVTVPVGGRAATLLGRATQLGTYEVQVWRGGECRLWGPAVSADPDRSLSHVTVDVIDAKHHLDRTHVGDVNQRNLASGVGLILRQTSAGVYADPKPYSGYVKLDPYYPSAPSTARWAFRIRNPKQDEDGDWVSWHFFRRVTAPANRDKRFAFSIPILVTRNPGPDRMPNGDPNPLRTPHDVAVAISRLPLGFSYPSGLYSQVEGGAAAGSSLTRYDDDITPGQWKRYTVVHTVPAGETKVLHCAASAPAVATYLDTLGARLIGDDGLDYAGQTPHAIVSGLVAHAQDSGYGKLDRNIDTRAGDGYEGSDLFDRFYSFDQHSSVGRAIDALVDEGLGEWRMVCGSTSRTLEWFYPRIARELRGGAIRLNSKGDSNVVAVVPSQPWRSAVTRLFAQEGVGGFERVEVEAAVSGDTLGWESVEVAPPETPPEALQGYADLQLGRAKDPRTLEVTVPPASRWCGPACHPGVTINVLAELDPLGVGGWWRVLERSANPDNDSATLLLAPEDPAVFAGGTTTLTADEVSPSFVGANTVTASASTIEVTPPAGSAGDLLLCAVAVRGNGTVTPPAGWATVLGPEDASTFCTLYVFSRITGEHEDATHTFTTTVWPLRATTVRVAGAFALEDSDANTYATDDNLVAPALTVGGAGRMAVAFYAARNQPGIATAPADYTEGSADTGTTPMCAAYYRTGLSSVAAAQLDLSNSQYAVAAHVAIQGA